MTKLYSNSTLTCRECRALIPLHAMGELKGARRRNVAAHIDGCARCYRVYRAQRDSVQDFKRDLPGVGASSADRARLGNIWSAVQDGIARPRRHWWGHGRARIGAAMVAMMMTLALALAMGANRLVLALPDPPTPTTAAPETDVRIAMATEDNDPSLSSTPEKTSDVPETHATVTPPRHPNYAPPLNDDAPFIEVGATDSP